MVRKIKALTKIFVKDFYQSTNLVSKETKKLNIKSIYFWMLVIVSITIVYVSYEAIKFCKSFGKPEIFINFYMIFLAILLMFQITIVIINIFFFSKDLELILPLPVKTKEILISKFNTVLIMAYITEIIFGLVPLILYGFLNYTNFGYFIFILLVLILLPILFIATIGIFALIFIKILSFIKNRAFLQNLTSILLIGLLLVAENILLGDISNLQEQNFFIFAIVKILTGTNIIEKCKYLIILFILDVFLLGLFILIGKKIYLRILLKTLNTSKRNLKFAEKRPIEIKNRKISIKKAYIKKEFKMLFKNPIFFMQTIFPVIMILITVVMLANVMIPVIDSAIQNSDETIKQSLYSMEFNSEMICIILGFLQVIFSLSSLSLTAISREGKNAIFMKYIPISYYRQFLYKNILQILLNTIVSIILLGIINIYIPKIGLINIGLIFIISIFINLINSYLMLIVDLRKPYLNWNSEHSVVKRNDNKSFQYALTIIMILIYMYLSKIFKDTNVTLALLVEMVIFIISFVVLNEFVKRKADVLFNKII